MGVDFLGNTPKPKRRTGPDVEFHMPEADKRAPARKRPAPPPESRPMQADHDVDLMSGYHSSKRMFWIVGATVLVLAALISAGLRYSFRRTPVAVAPVPTQEQTPTAQQPTGSTGSPQAPALPDTPLAPLRGALVRFPSSSTIYLVETNGELRKVITQTVVFNNGQTMAQIDRQLIYQINDSWKLTRPGKEDVTGQVDFDPRVLLPTELQPFL